jgi:hypothetical protein
LELEILSKRLVPTVKVVALTGKRNSVLAEKSDFVLWTGDPAEVCPLGLTPTTSTTTMAVIGDVLAVLAIHLSGYGANDYALRHHSGYLGEKSRKQETPEAPSDADNLNELRHVYETLHRENHDFQTNNWLLDDLPFLSSLPIESLIEVGCGNGLFSLEAAKYFKQVTAMDLVVSPVISQTDRPDNLEYIVSDIWQTIIPSAEALVSADFLEHFSKSQIPELIKKLSDAAPVQFHKIACYHDSRGLHLAVQSPQDWLDAFRSIDKSFEIRSVIYRRNREDQPVVTIARGIALSGPADRPPS